MQPYPRAPDLVWPGHLHGTGCLSARAVGTGFPTVGLRLWLGPGCGWSWVLFTPARCGWGLGWVCLGSVCGVVPLLPAVCGVRGWALVWACFRDLCGFLRVSLAPRRFRFRCAVWAGGSRLCPALLGRGVGLCFLRFFVFFFFFFFSGCWVSLSRALWSLPRLPSFGGCWLFFFLFFRCPFFPLGRCRCLGVAGLGWVVPLCLFGGPVFGALWVGGLAPFCVVGGRFGGCGLFSRARPPPPPFFFFFFFFGGGGLPGCSSRSLPSAGGCSVAGVWCGWSLATPGRGSCVLLPATPGWVSLPVVVGGPRHSWLGFAGGGGVWCVAVVCWWGCGWCVVWLVPRHSWRRFLCATPRHSWLGFASGGVGRTPPFLAGVRWRRCCVVCGVWRWCVGGVVAGVWCGWSLATPGGGSCVLLPATPGWVSLPVVVGGPRHSWLGSVGGVAVWCVVCGAGVLVGLWLACGVVGPSPLLAEVPVCYSPPLLAGFRFRWWWAVPATPGWGPLAALLCGVWCVAVVCWWGCGWRVVWLVPRHSWRRFLCATPRHSWLGFASGGGGRSPPLLAGVRWRRCCVVCGVWRWCVGGVVAGVWCGWSLATPGGGSCVLLPATLGWVSLPVVVGGPRHSWLGSACGGGVCCVVCGVWRWCVGGVVAGVWSGWSLATPGGGSCVLLPATPGWVSLPVVVGGPRHSWLGSVGGVAVWRVVCGAGVLVGLWLACGVVGPSPLLAEVPVCYSPPLLAGFRFRWWWAVPATPGWGPLAALLCGVWCAAVVCWWGCGWRVVWLVPRHSWRRFLCATPRHSWLGFASGGGGRSPPLLAGVRWRRCCVVCGVWRWCVGGVVAGVWCGWSLATPGGGSCVLLPATPGWVSLPVLVGGPRHSWLGSACGGGVWCVVCGVWRWCVGGVVAGVWCGWSLATPGGGSCVLLPATPGWVSLPVVVGGPRHSWLGSVGGVAVWCVVCGAGVLVGLWLVCGVVGPSPLPAEVSVCYSPPLLAGFRCRWWWAVPATPGWGPLAALLCGVWCVAVVCWWGCGWCVVWLVPRHSWRRFLCATPRHSWLGFAAAGGGRSPPLLAGVLWRRWCACFAWPGRAGRPPGRVVVRLTFSFGRFVFLLCLAPSGLGLPPSPSLLLPFLVGWGLWCVGWLLLGTCSCAVVLCVLCALSGFVAPGGRRCLAPVRVPWLWPAACLSGVPRGPAWCAAPRPVRSLSVLRSAFPTPWCLSPPRELAPPALLGGCAGHAEAGREPGSLCLPLAPAEAGALGSPRRTRSGPRDGVVPGGSLRRRSWAACAAVVGVCGPGH